MENQIGGNAEKAFGEELSALLGRDFHLKEASAGTPAETREPVIKQASHVKRASDMSLGEMLEDENFKQGVADEIEAQRYMWEPAVVSRLFGTPEEDEQE